jgi:hypothetical protein
VFETLWRWGVTHLSRPESHLGTAVAAPATVRAG